MNSTMLTRNKNTADKNGSKAIAARNPEEVDDKFDMLLNKISDITISINKIKSSIGSIIDKIATLSNGMDLLKKAM